jgi:hypothetical protein
MLMNVSYVRLYADDDGESHFVDVPVRFTEVDFAPPAAPLQIASLFPAERCSLLCAPSDWDGLTPHPSPRRQLFCNLRGEYEVKASNGERRTFAAGTLLLLEDTTGKGHSTRITSREDVLLVAVALADRELG